MSGHLSKPNDWKKFPKKVVDRGTQVELEHTSNPVVARRIATDHLVEMGTRYYTELDKMERRLQKKNKYKK
jgi:hypothetical protein